MKKQILAALLSFAFASVGLLPSCSAAGYEQIASDVSYSVAITSDGQSSVPAPVNRPIINPVPGTVQRPTVEHKKKPAEIKRPKQKTPRPKISRPKNDRPGPGIHKDNGKHRGQIKPDWKNKLPGIGKQKPANGQNIPTKTTGRTKVHGPHWCYGACSLHDAGLHNAPRTQKHWCDGYR